MVPSPKRQPLASYCPVPLSDTFCVEFATAFELSVMVSVALRAPFFVGLNVTLIVHLAPAARFAPQVVVRAKSPAFVPPMAILLMVNGAVPVLDSVTVCGALVVCCFWLPKLSDVDDTVATGAVPVPVNCVVTVGFTGSEVPTLSAALRAPTAVGLKVTENVQLAPAAKVAPHVLVCAKSPPLAPVIVLLLMVSVEPALPAFVSITVCAALVVPTI